MLETLTAVCDGVDLSESESHALFENVACGALSEVELSALLVGLRAKGETPKEIAGAALAFRRAAVGFDRPSYDFADGCGTGGDNAGTVNVSTAAALVAAAGGVPMAKHGNRSISSRCGSADVLESCGVVLDVTPERARQALDELGFCFLFAPAYHPGMRHTAPVRRGLGLRTILNVLGPLVNPARPPIQLMGVYAPELVLTAAQTLDLLGCRTALVVHGAGLDEIALHAPTQAALLRDGELREFEIDPADCGVTPAPLASLAGGAPKENALWLRRLLAGRGPAAHRDAVALNAGALLWIGGSASSLREGTAQALELLRSGRPHATLEAYVEATRGS